VQAPVIFIVFNRPEVTAQVLARIREARPKVLYVICDGPRPHRPDDAPKVAAVRALIESGVDWPCEVIRDYAETNQGCRRRVASGLNNAFARLDRAIVLEDDCLPDPSFFPFCDEMLERHRDDTEVMHLSGTNIAPSDAAASASYRFSRHPWIWGWASWSRAWRHYDFEMISWSERLPALRASFASSWEAQFWISAFDQARADLQKVNTWDFSWMFTVRSLGGLCVVPNANLVENLGIGVDSTHTGADSAHLRIPSASLALPLRHPRSRSVDRFADERITRVYCRQTAWLDSIRSRLRILSSNDPS
jgi:hypothetical protein